MVEPGGHLQEGQRSVSALPHLVLGLLLGEVEVAVGLQGLAAQSNTSVMMAGDTPAAYIPRPPCACS